jgi:hypothetical protein
VHKILVGALALSLIAGSAVMAGPDNQGNNHNRGGDPTSNRGRTNDHGQANDNGRNQGSDHGRQVHRRHQVCTVRHHHRVCYWR